MRRAVRRREAVSDIPTPILLAAAFAIPQAGFLAFLLSAWIVSRLKKNRRLLRLRCC